VAVAVALTVSVTPSGDLDRMTDLTPARHRPHLSPGRPHRVYVRLSDEEKQLVERAAVATATSPAGYLARAGLAAAADGRGVASGELAELQRELFAARRAVNMIGSNLNQAAAAANSTGELPVWTADAIRLCAAAVARVDAVTARIHRRLR
jgi:hypothetical protein